MRFLDLRNVAWCQCRTFPNTFLFFFGNESWDGKYCKNWESFEKEHQYDFQKKFKGKVIAPTGSLLATNLEFILSKSLEHCKRFSSEDNIKNVLLFFYNGNRSKPPRKISRQHACIQPLQNGIETCWCPAFANFLGCFLSD